jgi:hypothetical protein
MFYNLEFIYMSIGQESRSWDVTSKSEPLVNSALVSLNLKEERFIMAHGFRGFSPQSLAALFLGLS